MPSTIPRSKSEKKIGKNDDNAIQSSNIVNTRSRHRKISVKQKLRIYKPSDLKNLDINELQQRDNIENIETGVEKNEEKEVHLYRILTQTSNHLLNNNNKDENDNKKEVTKTESDKSKKKVAKSVKKKQDNYIPTPSTSQNWEEFNSFYHGKFVEPKNYIKFSATVEDCCGSNYNMDEKDETFLNESINKDKDPVKDKDSFLTEDEFELLCSAFENAIHERQPFLSMDPESILTFDELKPTLLKSDFADFGIRANLASELNFNKDEKFITQFDPIQDQNIRSLTFLIETYGSTIYDYWKARKIMANGNDIFPKLKFEKPGEKEEVDPYVCFRRREVRHPRKTRRIDVVNSHRLRLLYRELKHAKDMALLVAKRETRALEILQLEKKIFDDRCLIKDSKRSLNISGEEDDLINHKRRRPNILTVERRRQIEIEEAQAAREAAEAEVVARAEAAAAANASANILNNSLDNKRNTKNKLTKKQLEQLTKSGEKLTKQQLQQLQQLQAQLSGSNTKLDAKTKQQQAQLQKLQEQKLLQQQQQSIASHVYVKLPSCKVPDVILDDVDNILAHKEKSARKFVQDRMEKRKLEDGNLLFNLTDDPYNPVFDVQLPKGVDPSNAPFSSITSSKFKIDRSFYVPNLDNYIHGTVNDISVFNNNGEKIQSDNDERLKKIELYNPFQLDGEIHSREYPVKFRRRIGRSGIQYIDRKPNFSNSEVVNEDKSLLSDFIDFDAIEQESSNKNNECLNVYDSKIDELSRLYSRWKYDSPRNDYGLKFSDEPARLNQISNQTQVIRFGTMLGTKSYEQLRKATMKYRRDMINKLKHQKLNSQKTQLQEVPPTMTGINQNNNPHTTTSKQQAKTPKIKNEPSQQPNIDSTQNKN